MPMSSPVNQNGSFEFDRVLKSGYVQKRTQKTKVSSRKYSTYLRMSHLGHANRWFLYRPGSLSSSSSDPARSLSTSRTKRASSGI